MSELKDFVTRRFAERFQGDAELIIRAPGRVNIIGEHTDYNSGYVLPMAIDREILLAVRARGDQQVCILALDQQNEECAFDLSQPIENCAATHSWQNYPKGIFAVLQAEGYKLKGVDLVIGGNIPMGAGLSSSAALLMAIALMNNQINDLAINRVKLAQLCQRAENEYCGVQSGIMDQAVISLAQTGNALLIDCRSISFIDVPLPQGCAILVCNTMKSRNLHSSSYNDRREECSKALQFINKSLIRKFQSLREVSLGEIDSLTLPSPLGRRARHVISENQRVLKSVSAAQSNDKVKLGQLITQSHESLRANFDASIHELDLMVWIANQQQGVLGARLTGAGFGGCAIALVEEEFAEQAKNNITDGYQKETNIYPELYLVKPCNGASVL